MIQPQPAAVASAFNALLAVPPERRAIAMVALLQELYGFGESSARAAVRESYLVHFRLDMTELEDAL